MARTLPRSATLARHLLAAIVRDELRPGEPIDLVALGRRHGVSRTVVREALADLGGKGLVRARPRIGTAVAPQDEWNLLDPELIEAVVAGPGADALRAQAAALRRVVEPALAADAALAADRAQRSAVLRAVRSIAEAVGRGDAPGFADADASLHAAIASACGNRLLQAIDRALNPVRAAHRQRLAAEPGGPRMLRALVLQTGLALAVVRGERAAAAGWALELAALTTAADVPAPTLTPIAPRATPAPGALAPPDTASVPADPVRDADPAEDAAARVPGRIRAADPPRDEDAPVPALAGPPWPPAARRESAGLRAGLH